MSRPGQVKVRGTCKDGHVTEATSAPGRVTWQGECAHAGCEHTVHARRIPRERQQQQAQSGAAPESPQRSNTPEVREVSYDVPHPKRQQQQHEGQAGSGDPPEQPDPEQRPGGGSVPPAGDAGSGDGQRSGSEPEQPERPEQPGAELVGARRERPKRRGIRNPFAGLRFESPLDR